MTLARRTISFLEPSRFRVAAIEANGTELRRRRILLDLPPRYY